MARPRVAPREERPRAAPRPAARWPAMRRRPIRQQAARRRGNRRRTERRRTTPPRGGSQGPGRVPRQRSDTSRRTICSGASRSPLLSPVRGIGPRTESDPLHPARAGSPAPPCAPAGPAPRRLDCSGECPRRNPRCDTPAPGPGERAASVQHLFPGCVAGAPGWWQPRPHDDDHRIRPRIVRTRPRGGAAAADQVHQLPGVPPHLARARPGGERPRAGMERGRHHRRSSDLEAPRRDAGGSLSRPCPGLPVGPVRAAGAGRSGAGDGERPARRHRRLLAEGLTAIPGPGMRERSAKFAGSGASRGPTG